VSSSYRSSRLGLSHWDPYAMHRGGCLELYYCNMVEWSWWDSSLLWKTNWLPSVLCHCWFGHMTCKNRLRYHLWPCSIQSNPIPRWAKLTLRAVRVDLFTTRSLCWAYFRILSTPLIAEMCINYKLAQKKRIPGLLKFVVQQRYEMSK